MRHEAGYKDGSKQQWNERRGRVGKMKETQGGFTLQKRQKEGDRFAWQIYPKG